MKLYQIDAFADRCFKGNPAAVVPLGAWLPDETMQAIAAENNLSETAFLVAGGQNGADYHLRWFTPVFEVPLCGHATLAAAHVLFEHLGFSGDTVRFSTERSGELTAARSGDGDTPSITLDLPVRPCSPVGVETPLVRALGRQPDEVYETANNLMCVFDTKRQVLEIEPDAAGIVALETNGVIVTAPGTRHDFVSRYFAPKFGIHEDPVCGSAHCSLAPYWGERLGKTRLTAHQVSKREGELLCELGDGRVRLTGRAATYLVGEIVVGGGCSRNNECRLIVRTVRM